MIDSNVGSGSETAVASRICPICQSTVKNKTLHFEEKMFGMGGVFDYLDCGSCGAISIIEPPEDLPRYYPKTGYYSVIGKSGLRQILMHLRDLAYVKNYPGAGVVRKYLPNSALESTLRATEGNRSSRILDVGCGEGALLKSLARLGMRSLTGVDPLINQDGSINGIRLISGELSDVSGEFDIITFHHSLEHVPYPQLVLAQARSLLAPNGKVVVRIPTRDSLAYTVYRENWFQIDAPRHMCLHSYESIGLVAERAGLKINSILCDSHPMQFWASDLYRAGRSLLDPEQKVYKKRHRRFYRDLAQFANENSIGDQIVVQLVAA